MEFASISLSQNYVLSYLGAQPEDITFSVQLCYVGILTILPVQFRFLRYFEMRNYLLILTFLSIILNIACINVSSVMAFFFIRFFQGMVVGSISGSMLILIPSFLKMEHRAAFGSTIFYGTVLSSGVLLGLVASAVTLNSDFRNVYYYLILFQILVLIVILISFNQVSNLRKYPLYQIDWTGAVFFLAVAAGLAYTILYGSKYYWFTDTRIQLSTVVTVAGAILFLWRERIVKRPGLDLTIFRFKNFWVGLILLAVYYGSKESINIIFGYTVSVLQWSATQEMILGLCNITGLIIFMVISARILVYRKDAIFYFLFAGFSMSLLYHLWMYCIFTPDLAFEDLILPMFFQGATSGILFVPIMLFTLSAVPQTTGYTGLIFAACTRFTSLLNASAGFYNIQLYYSQLYKENFLHHITGIDENVTERLNGFRQVFLSKGFSPDQAAAAANASLARIVSLQTQLLTNRAVFLFIAILTACVLLVILLVYVIKTLRLLTP
ncbi:hypothetical protein ACRQ5D_21940 [Mucilaginibacter sp. P25]